MCQHGPNIWVGCEDGRITVLRASDVATQKVFRPHAGPVLCLEAVGGHVWSGSGDRSIMGHDAATFATLYTLGDQVCLPPPLW